MHILESNYEGQSKTLSSRTVSEHKYASAKDRQIDKHISFSEFHLESKELLLKPKENKDHMIHEYIRHTICDTESANTYQQRDSCRHMLYTFKYICVCMYIYVCIQSIYIYIYI